MSLILLHRLKFSIRDDVLLLLLLVSFSIFHVDVTRANGAVPPVVSRGLPMYSGSSGSVPSDSNVYENIHRILRDEENTFRNENVRWSRIDAATVEHRSNDRRIRRDAPITTTAITILNDPNAQGTDNSFTKSTTYSTKIVNFSGQDLRSINFTSLDLNDTVLSDTLVGNFSNNKLRRIDETTVAAKLINVMQLDLSANRMEYFNSTFNQLTDLNLAHNRLNRFASDHLRNVQTLDMSANNFSDPLAVQLNYLNDLQLVDLSCNQFRELHRTLFQNNSNLKVLNLSCNRLTKIWKNYFFNLVSVEVLQLSHNNISEVENDTFVYLPNLQYLDLSYNRIDATSIRALQGIPDLIGLSLAYNGQLGNALQGFVASWSLKELDASGTGLCQIPAALAQSVHTLNISDNHFQVIRCGDLDSYPLLQSLDVSSCEIMDIEDDALGRLEILVTLHLNYNNLTRVPASLPTSLVNLHLQRNQITDIQPNAFAQLTNLEVLNLSGNKLTYLPALPLPKLLTLNLRTSGLKGLSQLVVKTSPNLKDLLLDGNPIKCTELLGIAEWATPCRSDRTFELTEDGGVRSENNVNSTSVFDSIRRPHLCAKDRLPRIEKPICAREKLITAKSYPKSINAQPILVDDSSEIVAGDNRSATKTNASIGDDDDNSSNTVESTSNDKILGRKLGGKEITSSSSSLVSSLVPSSSNKSMGLKFGVNNVNPMWVPGATIDVNSSSNGSNNNASLSMENDVKSNNQDNKIPLLNVLERGRNNAKEMTVKTPPPATVSIAATPTTAATSVALNVGEAKTRSSKMTKSGRNGETPKATVSPPSPRPDKQYKITGKKSNVLPNRQMYFPNRAPTSNANKQPTAIKTTGDLHKTVNQTLYTDNKNVSTAKMTLFSTGHKFYENQTVNSGGGGGDGAGSWHLSNGGNKIVATTPRADTTMADVAGGAAKALGANNGMAGVFLSEAESIKNGVTAPLATAQASGRNSSNTQAAIINTGDGMQAKWDSRMGPAPAEKVSDMVSGSDMDIYQRDEEHGGPQQKQLRPELLILQGSDAGADKQRPTKLEKPSNAPDHDKLDHSAESLAQMMTAQKGTNNVLTRTGLVNAKLDIMGDVTPATKQQQWQKQAQQTLTNGGHYKNDTINGTTNKAISHVDNANADTQHGQEVSRSGGGVDSNNNNKNANSMANVMQRVSTIDPTNHKFTTRTIELNPTMTIKSKQSVSGYVRSELINTAGKNENIFKQFLGSKEITPFDVINNDHKKSAINASPSVANPAPWPISTAPASANDNKTINDATPTIDNTNNASMRPSGNENKLNGRKNMKIKINRNIVNAGSASLPGVVDETIAHKINHANKNCANAVDANSGSSRTECTNDIYTAEIPLNPQTNDRDGSVGNTHHTLNRDKLINNIVAESNVIMEQGHLLPLAMASATHTTAATTTTIENILHSTIVSSLLVHHHQPSVNVARTQRAPPLTIESQSSEMLTTTMQHAQLAKEIHSNVNNGNNNGDNGNTNSSPSKVQSEQWNDIRTNTSHPGLFIVIGVTIGMIVSLGLIHLYRCRKPWHRHRRRHRGEEDHEQYTPAHRDLLPMEILNSSSIQYTDVPIDLW